MTTSTSTSAPDSAARPYPMDNRNPHSPDHHDALGALLDPDTIRRLVDLSEGTDWTGTTCLEVGAGGGSIAGWFADTVGEGGRVVATDLEIDQIPPHPRLSIVQHDLLGNDALPDGPYNLIHARLVLGHLPQREAILHQLTQTLAPGGAILIEEWEPRWDRRDVVISAPDNRAEELLATYQRFLGTVLTEAGSDRRWPRRIHSAMLAAGLTDVRSQVHGQSWTGGDPGCRLVAAVLQQLRPRLVAAGMASADLDQVNHYLHDPRLVLHGHLTYATSGRRPPAP